MLQFNTLIVHVVRLKDLPVKGGRHLDAYGSLNITGTNKWRSKVTTQPQRVDENGCCEWNEHLEFQLNECYTDLQININHKSKLGSSETLASLALKLEEMPQSQSMRWFQLYKKGHPDKLRGMILIAFDFKNSIGGLSISQMSLNTIGKENKLDKLKKRMNFGRKKAKMDAQSMISVSLSRRSSICSNSSALAFSAAPSPIPPGRTSPQHDNISLASRSPPDPHPQQTFNHPPQQPFNHSPQQSFNHSPQPASNHLSLPKYGNEKRLSSTMEDSVSRCSDVGSESGKKHGSKFAAKIRQKAEKLLHIDNRKSVEEFHDNSSIINSHYNHAPVNSRPQSIASSSGFASAVSAGNLDNLNRDSSKEYLLQIVGQLRKELQLKEHRIQDLEEYTGRLLSKIIEKNPELLQVN